MKIVKNRDQSVIYRYYMVGGKPVMSVGSIFFFNFSDPKTLVSEKEGMGKACNSLGRTPLDFGMPKTSGEVLIHGKCCSLDGKPIQGSEAGFRIGNIEKKVHVFGDREWQYAGGEWIKSEPAYFTAIDISWPNAFGGDGFKGNFAGKGFIPPDKRDTNKKYPLPNIEPAENYIETIDDIPAEIGFMPMDLMHPERQKKTGTYDDTYIKTRWPYYPADFDWSFFNCAPPDQRITEYWRGNEKFWIDYMHPEKKTIEGRLPMFRPRVFVMKSDDGKPMRKPEKDGQRATRFTEIVTKLDTVWLFPNLELGAVIWRGTTETMDDEGSDVAVLMLRGEPEGSEPVSIEAYQEELRDRLKRGLTVDVPGIDDALKQKAEMEQEVEAEFAKLGIPLAEIKKLPLEKRGEALKVAMLEARAAKMSNPLSPAEIFAGARENIAKQGANLDRMEAQIATMEAQFGKTLDRSAIKAGRKQLAAATAKISKVEKQVNAITAKIEAKKSAAIAALRSNPKLAEKIGGLESLLAKKPESPIKFGPFPPEVKAKGSDAMVAYLKSDIQKQVEALKADVTAKKKSAIESMIVKLKEQKQDTSALEKMLEGTETPAMPDIGAIIAGLPGKITAQFAALREKLAKFDKLTPEMAKKIDAKEASLLKMVDKRKKQFDDALAKAGGKIPDPSSFKPPIPAKQQKMLDKMGMVAPDIAQLTREDVERLLASGEPLAGRMFGGLDLAGLDFSGKDLRQCNFGKANCTGTIFAGANLKMAIFMDTEAAACDFKQANLERTIFSKAVLRESDFSESEFKMTVFTDCEAEGSKFRSASIANTVFTKSNLAEADFGGIKAKLGSFIESNCARADFTGASFETFMIMKSDFTGARLNNAVFEKGTMGESNMENASFAGSSFKRVMATMKARFTGTDFSNGAFELFQIRNSAAENAKFSGARMKMVLFDDCDLTSADFSASDMPGCKIQRSELKGATFRGANLYKGSLRKSRMESVDFSGANLYGADFYTTVIGNLTKFTGADTGRTLLERMK